MRLWSLDVLRGLCAGIVFLSHWHLWSDFAPRPGGEEAVRRIADFCHDAFALLTWPTGGHHPAVLGFFVLSGFCIHYPCERRALAGAAEPDWRDYFARRFRRIAPVYWTACALGFVFVWAEHAQPSGSSLLALHAVASTTDVAVRLAGLAGIYPREIFAGNYILTTVTIEILMYAVYPLFFYHAARGRWSELGGFFLMLHVAAITMLRFFTPYWVFNSVFMLGIFWCAGAWAAHLFLAGRGLVSGRQLLLSWGGFLVLKAVPHFTGLNLLKQAAWGLVCVLGMLWVLRVEQRRPAWGNLRGFRALRQAGVLSYSLYSVHTPAIMLATWSLLLFGIHSYSVQLISTLATAVTLTLLVHHGIERPFHRPKPEGPTPAPGAAAKNAKTAALPPAPA